MISKGGAFKSMHFENHAKPTTPSDIPCFSTIKNLNGNCIGIVGNDSAYKGYHLARGKRTTVGPYSKNYTKDSDLYLILETIVKKLSDDMVSNAK